MRFAEHALLALALIFPCSSSPAQEGRQPAALEIPCNVEDGTRPEDGRPGPGLCHGSDGPLPVPDKAEPAETETWSAESSLLAMAPALGSDWGVIWPFYYLALAIAFI